MTSRDYPRWVVITPGWEWAHHRYGVVRKHRPTPQHMRFTFWGYPNERQPIVKLGPFMTTNEAKQALITYKDTQWDRLAVEDQEKCG